MAHFAKLNEHNVVVHVSVVDNVNLQDDSGNEIEDLGIKYLRSVHGEHTRWVQTSYSASFRKHYAGSGFKYDENLNAFIPPKPYDSWSLDEETCCWVPPVPKPEKPEYYYEWNEELKVWDEIKMKL